MFRHRRLLHVGPILLFSGAMAGLAHAGDDEASRRADELFRQGRTMIQEGRVPEACAAFSESMRLDPVGGTLMNLALCHELDGKLATAVDEYREALERAVSDGREDRESLARKRLAVLASRVARFTIDLDEARGVVVTMDGKPVASSSLNRPIALDPGRHVLVVSVAGAEPFEHAFSVPKEPGWRGSVRVPPPTTPRLPMPVGTASRPTPPSRGLGACPESMTRISGVCRHPAQGQGGDDVTPRGERTTWHWVGLGVGLAGMATATVTGLEALRANGDAKDECIPERGYCSADGLDAADRANRYAWFSTLSLGAGVAGLALWAWLPKERGLEQSTVALSTTRRGVVLRVETMF